MRTTNMMKWLKFSMAFVAVLFATSLVTANDDEKETKVDLILKNMVDYGDAMELNIIYIRRFFILTYQNRYS